MDADTYLYFPPHKIVAVAVDTSHALQRLHGRLPVVLASVSLKAKVVAPWMDTIVTLTSCSSSISGSDSARQGSRTAWKAEFSGRFPRSSGIQWSAVIDYTISNDTVDGPLIEWK